MYCSPGVDFTNILIAAFTPIFSRHKFINLSFKHKKAAQITFSNMWLKIASNYFVMCMSVSVNFKLMILQFSAKDFF
jgi:hypothetical protein